MPLETLPCVFVVDVRNNVADTVASQKEAQIQRINQEMQVLVAKQHVRMRADDLCQSEHLFSQALSNATGRGSLPPPPSS